VLKIFVLGIISIILGILLLTDSHARKRCYHNWECLGGLAMLAVGAWIAVFFFCTSLFSSYKELLYAKGFYLP